MLNNQSSGLGPKCQLCDEEQLEQCLAQLQFSDRAKESIRQLFASGEVNPIIESYLQKNCVLLDDEFREGERDLRARISQQAKQVSTDDRAAEEIKPVEPEPPKAEINVVPLKQPHARPISNPAQPTPPLPVQAVPAPHPSRAKHLMNWRTYPPLRPGESPTSSLSWTRSTT